MTNGGAALSDPTRRRVLQVLRSGPLSAGELSDQFDVSKPTMSAHFVPDWNGSCMFAGRVLGSGWL
ncbi:helix-turn-helix domain-containing protein [Luteimonas sp. A611]